jgi:hypothetical protein
MKKYYFVAAVFLSLVLFSCSDKDNVTNPTSSFSIQDQINKARPFESVSVYLSDGNLDFYDIHPTLSEYKLVNATADNGFLIVRVDNSGYQFNIYYNLSLVKSYFISSDLRIYY